MEMERINDDTIKVLIAPEDLEERGVDFLDLMGDHSRIERFFYSILEEVDVEHQFAESESVTFHVIPAERGLELYISRSGSFSAMEEVLEEQILKRLLKRRKSLLEGKPASQTAEDTQSESHDVADDDIILDSEVVRFATLSDFIRLARVLPKVPIVNSLYYMNQHYFLVLSDVIGELSEQEAYQRYLEMLEFGESHHITEAVLSEYGELIRAQDALDFFQQL